MTTPQEPHELLGVSRDASEEEIRSAFRNRAKDVHPDLSDAPDAAERFEELRTAYEFLLARTRLSEQTKSTPTVEGAQVNITPPQEGANQVAVRSSEQTDEYYPKWLKHPDLDSSNTPSPYLGKPRPGHFLEFLRTTAWTRTHKAIGVLLGLSLLSLVATLFVGGPSCSDYADLSIVEAALAYAGMQSFARERNINGFELPDDLEPEQLPSYLLAACQIMGIESFDAAMANLEEYIDIGIRR